MVEQNKIIAVKNMVCNRCIKVVIDELLKNKIAFNNVELGKIYLQKDLSSTEIKTLDSALQKEGFEIVETVDAKIVNQIKTIIIENIHYKKHQLLNKNYSTFLAENLGIEYTQLSRVFSEHENKTIEKFIIQQKIEGVKELLIYNELTLSEISYELNYSSPQHLSRQFKQIVGITPTQFKNKGIRKKLDTI
jgi:AraC-like DNA-binding protein